MRLIVFFFIFLFSSLSDAWEQKAPLSLQQCSIHYPYGLPQSLKETQNICRTGYLSAWDSDARIPLWVSYTLTPDKAIGCTPRSNAFVSDSFAKNSSRPDDYSGTNYDKGHMAPNGDMSWNNQVELESFLMSNMSPQAGSFNRGIWKLLETSVRGWVIQGDSAYTIYVGSIYESRDKKIGSGVVVPHAFYKIVVKNSTGEVAGWMFPHTEPYPNLGNDLVKFRVPVKNIMKITGVNFLFPKNAEELMPGKEWELNFGDLTKQKQTTCKIGKD